MSDDERDRSGAAADADADENGDAAGSGQTAVGTVPQPQRPTGKRSRQRASGADGNGGVDVVSTATELSGGDAETKKTKKLGRVKKAKKKTEGPSRNPIVYVYNYLKQVVAELRKVIWPNRKQMITYTGVVLAFLMFMVTLIAGSDYGFAKLVLLVFGE